MPWSEVSVMDLRLEFVMLAEQPGANVSALCRRFGISRKTGYKWLGRAGSGAALSDRSRRPRSNPRRTPEGMEASVLAVRSDHPCWGGRKIARRLADLGETDVPAPSTVTAILRRHGVALGQAGTPAAFQRFERLRPNELWQMDFKGHFALAQGRCHPLTVLDDCSRFNLCLAACGNEQGETVQGHLRAAFRRYGLPEWIDDQAPRQRLMPWGDGPSNTRKTRPRPRHIVAPIHRPVRWRVRSRRLVAAPGQGSGHRAGSRWSARLAEGFVTLAVPAALSSPQTLGKELDPPVQLASVRPPRWNLSLRTPGRSVSNLASVGKVMFFGDRGCPPGNCQRAFDRWQHRLPASGPIRPSTWTCRPPGSCVDDPSPRVRNSLPRGLPGRM